MKQVDIEFILTHPDAKPPQRAYEWDAGWDLYCVSREELEDDNEWEYAIRYHTGVKLNIPDGYVGLIFPRSSIYKKSQFLTNSVGVIDAGYQGEISAVFKSLENGIEYDYNEGDKIMQIVFIELPTVNIKMVEQFSTQSQRGEKGWGSSNN